MQDFRLRVACSAVLSASYSSYLQTPENSRLLKTMKPFTIKISEYYTDILRLLKPKYIVSNSADINARSDAGFGITNPTKHFSFFERLSR